MKLVEAKIVVLGMQGVGKTSIISRYTGKVFNKHVSPTIGATFFCCSLTIDDYRVKLKIWDTAGQERFRAMVKMAMNRVVYDPKYSFVLYFDLEAPMYYRNANAAFLVYEITSYESYLDMKSWVEELQRNIEEYVFICILGNKADVIGQRKVKSDEAQEYANTIGASFIETSAITNDGIEAAFLELTRGIIKMSQNASAAGMRVFDSMGSVPSTPTTPDPIDVPSRESVFLRAPSPPDEKPTFCC